jgi:arylsulfatase A-like enzyme/Tfp pilus assembly protein PilF
MRRLALLMGALATAGCRATREVPSYPDASLVLISIDTLRADRLPAYGYAKGSTPSLDALARVGIVFEDVVSHCPLTLPAHASMFTGLLPFRHGVRDNLGFMLSEGHETLATRAKQGGFATGAAVSAFVLRSGTGIARGFDRYDDAIEVDAGGEALGLQQRDGAAAVDSLAEWLTGIGGRRFFAFLHLYEPHTPYAPPERFRHLPDPYDGEVAYSDELVGRFVARLRDRGLLERVALAVTSDHGEGLGDHGEQEHGLFLYRESLRVPLLLRLPRGDRGGTRVAGTVAQVDLTATLLDLMALPWDGLDGVSLRPALSVGRAPARRVYSETYFPRFHFAWSELLAVTDDRHRLIRAPRPEVYDLKDDPQERRNLAAERGTILAGMNAWLDAALAGQAAPKPEAASAEVQERLRALGYVGGGVAAPAAGTLPDPKDKVAVYERFRRAAGLGAKGRHELAAAELRGVLAEEPRMLDAWESLGHALLRTGREQEALQAFAKVLEGDPNRASTHLALARLHAFAGRVREAEGHAELAAATAPGRSFEMLAEVFLGQRRLKEAAAFARRSLAADRDSLMSHFVLGVVARTEGRCDEALAEYGAAEAIWRRRKGLVVRDLHAGMADCLARLGREPEAEREFLAEIETIPHSREGRVGLAMLYRSQARDRAAREVVAGIVNAHPNPGPEEYGIVVRTLAALGDRDAAREWAGPAQARFPGDARFGSPSR